MASTFVKTEDEILRLRESGKRLADVLQTLLVEIRPGMSTGEIDKRAEDLIRQAGGLPVFKGYGAGGGKPFPASLCTSVNNEVVHGIPKKETILKDGDVLKLDIGMRFEGMVTDMARTVAIGQISDEAKKLITVTEESLRLGISTLHPGGHISDYSRAVQTYVEKNGFSVVRDLVGHGVGRELHEEPNIPNFLARGMREVIIKKGMTLALEPMVNAGKFPVKIASDGWTFVTADGSLSAHFEDTVVITEGGAEVVTSIH